jgi:hypothetical protein
VLMAAEIPQTHRPAGKRAYLWLERILQNWANWMFSGGYTGFHVGAGSVGEGFRHCDWDGEAYRQSDVNMAKLTDAVIRDLKPAEREAIEAEYLRRAWTRSIPIGPVLVLAHESVRRGLERRGFLWQ